MKKLTLKNYKELATKYDKAVIGEKEISAIKYFISEVKRFLDLSGTYRNCYFWTPKGNSDQRRKQELRDSFTCKTQILDISIDFSFNLTISCKNFYVEKTATINELKDLLKRVQTALYVISFDKHLDLLRELDSLIDLKTNDNDTLLDLTFYTKNVEAYFSKNLNKVKMNAGMRQELRARKAAKAAKAAA